VGDEVLVKGAALGDARARGARVSENGSKSTADAVWVCVVGHAGTSERRSGRNTRCSQHHPGGSWRARRGGHSANLRVEVRGWRMAEVVDPGRYHRTSPAPNPHPTLPVPTMPVHTFTLYLPVSPYNPFVVGLAVRVSEDIESGVSATANQCLSGPPVPHTLP